MGYYHRVGELDGVIAVTTVKNGGRPLISDTLVTGMVGVDEVSQVFAVTAVLNIEGAEEEEVCLIRLTLLHNTSDTLVTGMPGTAFKSFLQNHSNLFSK